MKKQSLLSRAFHGSISSLAVPVAVFLLSIPVKAWSQSQSIIVDHTCTKIKQIPESAIVTAKQNLHIAYGHTSHGSQLITGMNGLIAFANNHGLGLNLPDNIFAWNQGGTGGALDLHDDALGGDVGYYPDWVNNTRSYLGAVNASGRGTNHPDVNVIIWSWCGQAAGLSEQQMISNYLTPMTNLENDYFAVKFVYMTGHLDGSGSAGNLTARNNQIRAYCNTHDKILYDFADIESYDPDGLTHYMPLMCTDNCDYVANGGSHNWALDWQNSHTLNSDWYNCSPAHSQALNGNLKAYAAWWLWARLGGWSGGRSTQYTVSGRVTAGGSGLSGVAINGLPGNPVTNGSGYYSAGVDAGWSGTATPTRQYYAFTPDSTTYTTVAANQTTNYATTLNGALVVTAPVASTIWETGRAFTITWQKQGAQNAYVKIMLYKGTSTRVKTLASKTDNDGLFDWQVPTSLSSGSAYFIRIQTIDGSTRANSEKFSIIRPAITVTAPGSGSVWLKDTTRTITWNKLGTQDANVKIQLYRGTSKTLDIALSAANSGTYDWSIPLILANNTYSIRITTLDALVQGSSNGFSIASGLITVTAPANGIRWQRGVAHAITWTGAGTLNANVKIQLLKGTAISTIVASTANNGSYEWIIPSSKTLASNYKIRITTVDNLVRGQSSNFTIANSAGLTLLAPNGGEILKPLARQVVRWQKDPAVQEIKLEYSRDNGSTFSLITDHMENTGSCDWQVPVNFTRNAIVRVSDSNGRFWQEDGLLEYSFKFNYGSTGDEPGLAFWLGSSDPKSPSYGFSKVMIGRERVEFNGINQTTGSLAGAWHELRLRIDFHLDTAALYLDERPLFENMSLYSSPDHYFEPCLSLQAGAAAAVVFRLDDLKIRIVRLDAAGNDLEWFTVLTDPFDHYDEITNHVQNCWHSKSPNKKESLLAVEAENQGNRVLRLQSMAGRQVLIYLPLAIPDRVPFDISDHQFVIENQ